jgi:hypothetical protein
MSFKPVRQYLSDRLTEVDSDFLVYDATFANDFVGDNNCDKRFHIFYGNITASVANQNPTTDTINATVKLFFRGFRDSNESLDNALDLANEYRVNCLRQSKLAGQVHIKRVVCTSITAESLPSNDQQFVINLEFSITYICGTGINLDCE